MCDRWSVSLIFSRRFVLSTIRIFIICIIYVISVRETVSIPETRGSASDVPYIALEVENITASCENDRCTIEGSLIADILFIEEETLVISSFEHRIPFRTSMDMPGACADSYAECGASIKEIWFDRVNSRQIDINCSISAGVSAWNTAVHEFIDKVCYIDDGSAPHVLKLLKSLSM